MSRGGKKEGFKRNSTLAEVLVTVICFPHTPTEGYGEGSFHRERVGRRQRRSLEPYLRGEVIRSRAAGRTLERLQQDRGITWREVVIRLVHHNSQ